LDLYIGGLNVSLFFAGRRTAAAAMVTAALFHKFVRWLFDFVDVALESRCRRPSSLAQAGSSIVDTPTFHDLAPARLQG
jgi:hypothetical protein